MKLFTANILLFLLIFASDTAFSQNPAPTIPDFTFYKLDGSPFTKDNLSKNNKIVFIFFDASCEHCQQEVENIGKSYKEFKSVALYMISMDETKAIKTFMSSYGKRLNDQKNIVLLQDKDRIFIPKFSPNRYPAIYIYSAKGNLIQYFGGETKIKELIKAVK